MLQQEGRGLSEWFTVGVCCKVSKRNTVYEGIVNDVKFLLPEMRKAVCPAPVPEEGPGAAEIESRGESGKVIGMCICNVKEIRLQTVFLICFAQQLSLRNG